MTRATAHAHFSILLTLALHVVHAGAVCTNPRTSVSGYQLPLAREVREAEAIVVGRIVAEQALQDDPADPDGVMAQDVTVRILARLKGDVPASVVIRNENTSSRYPMDVGEEHVLFLNHSGRELWVDACGNSALKKDAPRLVSRIRKQLRDDEASVPKQTAVPGRPALND